MSKEAVIWIVIAVYGIFMLAVGILNSKKSSGGMADFTLCLTVPLIFRP